MRFFYILHNWNSGLSTKIIVSHHNACICYLNRWDCCNKRRLRSISRSKFKFKLKFMMEGKGAAVSIITSRPHGSARLLQSASLALYLSFIPSCDCECCVMLSDITRSVEQQVWALLTQPAMLPCENNNTQPQRQTSISNIYTQQYHHNRIARGFHSQVAFREIFRFRRLYRVTTWRHFNPPNTLILIFPGNVLLLDTEKRSTTFTLIT